jgi:hypothetical protein
MLFLVKQFPPSLAPSPSNKALLIVCFGDHIRKDDMRRYGTIIPFERMGGENKIENTA